MKKVDKYGDRAHNCHAADPARLVAEGVILLVIPPVLDRPPVTPTASGPIHCMVDSLESALVWKKNSRPGC